MLWASIHNIRIGIDTERVQGQLQSTVQSRKQSAQSKSRGILGAAISTARLLDGLSQPHRAALAATGCDVAGLAAFAALPLTLRRVPSGMLVAISAPEPMMSDAALAARQLRNAVVVTLLDTAQSVREVLQDDMLFSEEGVEVDSHMYLPCSEVRTVSTVKIGAPVYACSFGCCGAECASVHASAQPSGLDTTFCFSNVYETGVTTRSQKVLSPRGLSGICIMTVCTHHRQQCVSTAHIKVVQLAIQLQQMFELCLCAGCVANGEAPVT